MLLTSIELLRKVSYWTGLRATMPLSALKGQYGESGFGVLMYHRICAPVQGLAYPTWNVTPENLKSQLEYLLRRGYEPWKLTDLVEQTRNGQAVPRRAFAVTFDDGYRCVATNALPILKELQIPATIFIATGMLGTTGRMAQDDWSGAGDGRVPAQCYQAMSLSDCDKFLESDLFSLGSHTHSHQDFRGRELEFEKDVNESLDFMRKRWGIGDIPFAFPYGCTRRGFCSPAMRDIVKRSGFCCAVTADNKIVDPQQDDIYGWGRINVNDSDSGRVLAAKLDNWYGAIKKVGFDQFVRPNGNPLQR